MWRPPRNAFAAALAGAGLVLFASVLNGHEPIKSWLFLRYLRAVLSAVVFSLASLIVGHALVVRVLRRTLPLAEHLAVALPLGVLGFGLTSFVVGALGWYGPAFFVLGPCVLVALGARDFMRFAGRLRRHTRRVELGLTLTPLRAMVLAFGCLGVFFLWFTILTPSNASYDARWYHLTIAETYVAHGGIARYDDGWVFGAFPALASLLDAWAFCAPGLPFDRVEAAAHVEFAILLMTLGGVVAVVRRVLGERAPLSWVALCLFPGITCYDSGLVLGADHVAALFAAPIFLLSLRYLEAPSHGLSLLLAAALAGALLTKYSAAILVPLPAAVVLTRAVLDARRHSVWRALRGPAWITLALVVLTAPHWLKNWVAYGDPLFPLLRHWLPAHPWNPGAEAPFLAGLRLHHPPFGLAGVWEMLTTLVTFSFVPHDFSVYHRDLPVFGSLFTLLTPLALLLGPTPRLGWLLAGSYLGLASWFWMHEFDRYLQVLVPWMAAATAVVLTHAWRARGALRPVVAALVALQVVWGAAVPFFPTHRTAAGAIVNVVVDLLGRGVRGESAEPPVAFAEWEMIARALPSNAKLLVHEERIRAGLGHPSVVDFPGDQGAFYWGEPGAATRAEVWRSLRAHGVTHLMWQRGVDQGYDTVAGALAFFDFATHETTLLARFGVFEVARLRDTPPPATQPAEVLLETCEKPKARPQAVWNREWVSSRSFDVPFGPGLYALTSLARSPGDARPLAAPVAGVTTEDARSRARFLVFDARCRPALPRAISAEFETLATRGTITLLVRRQP